VEEPQENGLTSRAKAIFMIVLAVLLLGTLGVFALLAATLPTSVPSDERVSALLADPHLDHHSDRGRSAHPSDVSGLRCFVASSSQSPGLKLLVGMNVVAPLRTRVAYAAALPGCRCRADRAKAAARTRGLSKSTLRAGG
jgi:hypothetical protein